MGCTFVLPSCLHSPPEHFSFRGSSKFLPRPRKSSSNYLLFLYSQAGETTGLSSSDPFYLDNSSMSPKRQDVHT